MGRLYFNEDCTDFFYNGSWRPGEGGAAVDRFVDGLAAAGVSVLLCNTNAQLTNYASAVWQPFWDGYDPEGPDTQPLLAGLGAAGAAAVSGWRHMIGNMQALHAEGVDYPARMLGRSRQLGVSPWISLRMNDVHNNDEIDHPIHSRFWRQHPEYWRRGSQSYYARAFDFAQAGVRDYYLALVQETLSRYDVDGLELDFLREPYLFSLGEEDAGRQVLTEWVAGVRQEVDRHAARRGHRILLGARSPSRPDAALAMGLDPVAWARRGLIDLLVVSPRWSTIEFDLPIPSWRQLLAGTDVTLLGGLEILLGHHPTAPKRVVTAAEARGAAAQILHSGADSVYLFNYFPVVAESAPSDDWRVADYAGTLRSLAKLEELTASPRRHVLTFTDINGPEGSRLYPPPLPATGTQLFFTLPTGPQSPAGARLSLTLALAVADGVPMPPAVTVNGVPAIDLVADVAVAEERRLTYLVPAATLGAEGANTIEVSTRGGPAVKVQYLDVAVEPETAG